MNKTNVFIVVFVIITIGCNRYLDKQSEINKVITNRDYELMILGDKNIFKYKSPINAKRDDEIILTTLFEISLPKKLLNFEIINMSEFSFYYAHRQCILINNDNERKISIQKDTFYVPDKKELDAFISKCSKGSFKYNIRNNELIADRKFAFFKKQNSTILLYNIEPNNFNYFLNSAKSLSY